MFKLQDVKCPVSNFHVYKFSNGTYVVTFDTDKGRQVFTGSRNHVVSSMARYMKFVLNIKYRPGR